MGDRPDRHNVRRVLRLGLGIEVAERHQRLVIAILSGHPGDPGVVDIGAGDLLALGEDQHCVDPEQGGSVAIW